MNTLPEMIEEAFKDSSDFVKQELGRMGQEQYYAYFIRTLAAPARLTYDLNRGGDRGLSAFLERYEGSTVQEADLAACEKALCEGQTVLCPAGASSGIILETSQTQQRSIQSPSTENVLHGPMYSFNENLSTNIALIRQRVHSPKLKNQTFSIGEIGRTQVSLLYVQSMAEPSLIRNLQLRLNEIRISDLEDSGQLLRLLVKDKGMQLFPRSMATERPDRAASALLKGKVVLLVDGSPFALIVPVVFTDFWHSPEDTYLSPYVAYFLTTLRFLALFINLFLPAAYVALTSVNVDVNRLEISLSASASREGVPYPVIIETVLMLLVIDFIVEAGVRLPKTIGSTVTMVGGVVLGQAVIQANIVSNLLVFIVAATAITNFIVIDYQMGLIQRMLKYIVLAGAGIAGLLGMMFCFACLVFYLSCLESFGKPYLTSLLPEKERSGP